MSLIVGHRGSRHLWPENTLEGFRGLLTAGADGVEFDVHLTADDQLVVIHDPMLERTTYGSGPVRQRTLAELQSIRLRDTAETLPGLNQVLEVFQNTSLEVHIELKSDHGGRPYPGLEARVLSAIHQYRLGQRAILTSFNCEVLTNVRRLDSSAQVLFSVDNRTLDRAGGLGPVMRQVGTLRDVYVAVEQSLLRGSLQQFVRRCGAGRIGVWVVNEEAELNDWLGQNIRQITTDRVDLAVKLRRSPS